MSDLNTPDRLFVYGTLAPGRDNYHVLEPLGGEWLRASVRGRLVEAGWGAAMGCPGMVPDADGEAIEGWLLVADSLAEHWPMLDAFEGAEYQRVSLTAELEDGSAVDAWVYALSGLA